ncbi:MAG: metallophosphoesterase family protein [Candidatus Hodarchaeales archaeon]
MDRKHERMRILFGSDFHGDFSRLENLANDFDLCISCGDNFDYHKMPEKLKFPIPFFSIRGNKELWGMQRYHSKFQNYSNFFWLNENIDRLRKMTQLEFLGIDYLHEPDEIPTELDFLISHQPAFGLADQCSDSFHVKTVKMCGSKKVRKLIENRSPRYIISGHLHNFQKAQLQRTIAITLNPALSNTVIFWENGTIHEVNYTD